MYLYCTEDGFLKASTYVPCSKTTVTLNKKLLASYAELTPSRFGWYKAKQVAEFNKTVLIFIQER